VSHRQIWSSTTSYDAPSVVFDFVPLFPIPTQTKIMQNVTPSTVLCLKTSHTLNTCLGHLGELGIGGKIILKIISET
jgi:hypothetical protein